MTRWPTGISRALARATGIAGKDSKHYPKRTRLAPRLGYLAGALLLRTSSCRPAAAASVIDIPITTPGYNVSFGSHEAMGQTFTAPGNYLTDFTFYGIRQHRVDVRHRALDGDGSGDPSFSKKISLSNVGHAGSYCQHGPSGSEFRGGQGTSSYSANVSGSIAATGTSLTPRMLIRGAP